jgi:iron complex transport system ATP-binding protein
MGLNGAGKSTFIRTVAGLQEPISGSIEINGVDINSVVNQDKAKLLAVVLTGRTASHYMTVRELVELGRYPHTNWKNALTKEDILAVDNAIEAVGLTSNKDRLVSELSDGNAQKAMIARALAQDTQLIILDEPTVHLDLRNKLMILQLLTDLSKQYNKSILLASHDLAMMIKVADKIWLFNKNELITGIPEDLMNRKVIDGVLGSEEFKTIPKKINNNDDYNTVTIIGNMKETYWLKHALQRNGFEITKSANLMITVAKDIYSISFGKKTTTCTSIEETLITLKRLLDE